MGMFDYVKVPPIICPNCGNLIEDAEWQSKDDECELATIPFTRVNRFYTDCPHCHKWLTFRRRKEIAPEPTAEYLKDNYELDEEAP